MSSCERVWCSELGSVALINHCACDLKACTHGRVERRVVSDVLDGLISQVSRRAVNEDHDVAALMRAVTPHVDVDNCALVGASSVSTSLATWWQEVGLACT